MFLREYKTLFIFFYKFFSHSFNFRETKSYFFKAQTRICTLLLLCVIEYACYVLLLLRSCPIRSRTQEKQSWHKKFVFASIKLITFLILMRNIRILLFCFAILTNKVANVYFKIIIQMKWICLWYGMFFKLPVHFFLFESK